MKIRFALIACVFAGALAVRVSGQSLAGSERSELVSVAELIPDHELVDISPFAALIEATQRYRARVSCDTAGFFSSMRIEGEGKQLLTQLSMDTTGECELYRHVWEETGPVFEEIKSAGQLPETSYVFSVFVPSPPNDEGIYTGGYKEETIGLFVRRESCERMEQRAHRSSLPTRQCVEWAEPELN